MVFGLNWKDLESLELILVKVDSYWAAKQEQKSFGGNLKIQKYIGRQIGTHTCRLNLPIG